MNREELKNYLDKGTDIVGGGIGGALGLIGGPLGAIGGGVLGVAITHGIKEIVNRQLSNREEIRVSASTVYILSGLSEKFERGEQIRQDDFFNNLNGRSNAEELFEGVILKCKEQYQEKKIKYISKIYEKAIFDSNISSETANQILIIAESFTYRKFCIISFYKRNAELYNINDLMQDPYVWYPNLASSLGLDILKQDIFDLINLGIIDSNNTLMTTSNDVMPGKLKLTKIGMELFELMSLNEILKEDLDPIFNELKYKEEFGISQYGTKNGIQQN
ncbi:hypothetical protein [uncultured Tenacibaculum sp.]|uniref:hypothetical protein n=1 Tax=uncultured Tenacibaculum sp. TaxID=174713 RepID=UPI0026204F42|nr:hypothetical protein [uncultured Tenacibaculum sp.]